MDVSGTLSKAGGSFKIDHPVDPENKYLYHSFGIAGGSPGLKVSWTVTGVRQDVWANAHRVPTEVDKNASERGKYLYPEERGKPASMSVVSREKP